MLLWTHVALGLNCWNDCMKAEPGSFYRQTLEQHGLNTAIRVFNTQKIMKCLAECVNQMDITYTPQGRAVQDELAEREKFARGMKCCQGTNCHNYPMPGYFDCQNNGGQISGRSGDSEEEKVARGMKCCQGSNCHNYPMPGYFDCQNNGG